MQIERFTEYKNGELYSDKVFIKVNEYRRMFIETKEIPELIEELKKIDVTCK